MRKEFLPFTRPEITPEDVAAVNQVLTSGWITNGPENAAFERDLANLAGVGHAVALSSATAAMHVYIKAKKLQSPDEVIIPSMTWVSMVNMLVLEGIKPVFADVDRDTLLITPESVAKVISPRTKLIVPVHFAGAPVDLDGIRKVAGDIPILEDAAHAVGTFYKGRHIGADNDAIFSFHAIKNITCGEGGALITNSPELDKDVRRWKFHGISMDAFDRQNKGRSPQAEVLEPGYKYNLTDICAALGRSQLQRYEEINAKRRMLAMQYRELLSEFDEIIPLADPQGYDFTHAWHLFVVRVDSPKISRDQFMAELKALNIGTGLHFRCVHLQHYYRNTYGFEPGCLPNTEYNSDRICSLPLFPAMTENDVKDVVDAIRQVLTRS